MCFSLILKEKVMSVPIEDELHFHVAKNIGSNDTKKGLSAR